jgi:CheY-like chemotaxis protein
MATRVLVVDDSSTIRRVVAAVLHRHGYETVPAADGQAALDELARSTRPQRNGQSNPAAKIDVALVDFVMPRMNGLQLCRAIRAQPALRSLPVVFMSAKPEHLREQSLHQAGAIDAISKPFDARALVAVIENAVRRQDQSRARGESIAIDIGEDYEVVEIEPSTIPPSSQVALEGDISIVPVGAVLQLLQIETQTGVLVATDGKSEVTIAMRLGLIDLVQARGAGSEFRLGRYFVEHGLVSPEDIDRLLREGQAPNGSTLPGRKLLGDVLVDAGRVTREQLRDALERQSSELVYDVLRWQKGHFAFRREPPPPLAQSARLGLPVASVVMEGFRRVDEWRLVEARLGSFESVLLPDPASIASVPQDRLAKGEQRLLEMVDGKRTVHQIVEQSHMSSFDACKVLYQLLEARLVRRRPV